MFFKKNKSNDFKLKTEEDEEFFKYEDDDADFFRFDNSEDESDSESFVEKTDSTYESAYDNNSIDDVARNNIVYEDYYFDENETPKKSLYSLASKIVNILLIVVLVIFFAVLFDVIMLTRFDKGPFFAIRTKTYKDGGTKVYHGLGYKVIKYNETDGRHDMVVGNYSITYSTLKYETTVMDLAIKFRDNKEDSEKLLGKYMSIKGTVSSVDKKKRTVKLKYNDSDKKYQTTLICRMDKDFMEYHNIDVGDSVNVLGILYDYNINQNIELYVKNCFID